MATSEERDELVASARDLGWTLAGSQAEKMWSYLDGVLAANERLNLTRITDRAAARARHLLDSLAFGLHLLEEPAPRPRRVIDLGTGGGFPGVPAAIALETARVMLVESRGRKLEAVLEVSRHCGISNVFGMHGRLRELQASEGEDSFCAHLVLARAVGALRVLVRESARSLAPGGTLLCWKSARLDAEERSLGRREAERRGLVVLPDISYRTDRDNLLIRYRKLEPGP